MHINNLEVNDPNYPLHLFLKSQCQLLHIIDDSDTCGIYNAIISLHSLDQEYFI